jgi:hypothetical protein
LPAPGRNVIVPSQTWPSVLKHVIGTPTNPRRVGLRPGPNKTEA